MTSKKLSTFLRNVARSNRFRYKIMGAFLVTSGFCLMLIWQSFNDFEENTSAIAKSPMVSTHLKNKTSLKAVLGSFNRIGQVPFHEDNDWNSFIAEAFELIKGSAAESLVLNLTDANSKVSEEAKLRNATRIKKTGPRIYLGTTICGKGRLVQGLTMIKSASMFAQDASLNVIVFSDAETIVELGIELFLLRRMVNAAGWDFNFELHLEWFPPKTTGKAWREMYQPCATMRLFFPDLLPHIDSIIYLDTDVVVVSNLTEFWNKISEEMGDRKMAAAASNSEQNSVNEYTYKKIPHFGKQGINAGIMLMNLTQMRQFNLSTRAIGIKNAYAEKLTLADQDIYNAIFHAYDDRLLLLSCTYNFYSVHCDRGATCNRETKRNTCFCGAARIHGMHLIHGCEETFWKYLGRNHFIQQIYRQFKDFHVIRETPLQLLAKIKKEFKPQRNCYNVDYDMVYKNAETYFTMLYQVNKIQ